MALGINGIVGFSLILIDLSMRITLNLSGIKSYPDFGLFYVGILNVIFNIMQNYFNDFPRRLASILLIISIIYPISNILESLLNYSFFSKLETWGLWSLCIAVIIMIISKLKI
ncbi:MAG: hypothetical protein ABIL49_08420 [candidate division WOR-3 bacterium]|jgi:hypothetical protein